MKYTKYRFIVDAEYRGLTEQEARKDLAARIDYVSPYVNINELPYQTHGISVIPIIKNVRVKSLEKGLKHNDRA